MFVDMKAGYGRYCREEFLAGAKRIFNQNSVMHGEQERQSGRNQLKWEWQKWVGWQVAGQAWFADRGAHDDISCR